MNTRQAAYLLVAPPMLAALVAWAGHAWFNRRESQTRLRHQQEQAEETQKRASEQADRKVIAHEQALARTREHEQRLLSAWGGPTEAAWKDPDLSIPQMLVKLAETHGPPGTRATLQVDSFTEFDLVVELAADSTKGQIAEIALGVLRHASTYLSSIRFLRATTLVAHLDEQALRATPDWTRASAAEVENLLAPRPAGAVPADSTVSSGPADWLSRLKTAMKEVSNQEEQRTPERQADQVFANNMEAHRQKLLMLVYKQDEAIKLIDVRTEADLLNKLQLLKQTEAALSEVRTSILNAEEEYQKSLQQQKLDPVAIQIYMRVYREQQARRRPQLERLFQVLAQRQSEAAAFISAMQQNWGNWSAQGNMVYFTSPAAQAAYRQGSERLEQANAQVTATIRALSD